MKKIAIKKELAYSNGLPMYENFHFSIMPKELETDFEEALYNQLGYEVVEVSNDQFERLCEGFGKMIQFQLEVNILFNKLEKEKNQEIKKINKGS